MSNSLAPTLLRRLDVIAHETTEMLSVLEGKRLGVSEPDRREAKRRVLKIRTEAQELFEWINAEWKKD
jgi:hypothetical protein